MEPQNGAPRAEMEPQNEAARSKMEPENGSPCTKMEPQNGAPRTSQNGARRTKNAPRKVELQNGAPRAKMELQIEHDAPKWSPKTPHHAPKWSPKTPHHARKWNAKKEHHAPNRFRHNGNLSKATPRPPVEFLKDNSSSNPRARFFVNGMTVPFIPLDECWKIQKTSEMGRKPKVYSECMWVQQCWTGWTNNRHLSKSNESVRLIHLTLQKRCHVR